MNYFQRAWLYALKPVTYLINEKLAKRSGLLGKLGKFFMIGPREFGFHPTNRLMILTNRILLEFLALSMHKYSVLKSMTHNGYYTMRLFRHTALIPVLSALGFLFIAPNLFGHFDSEDGTTLEHLTTRVNLVPINALNQRVSAHYTEINAIYGTQMLKKYLTLVDQIVRERNEAPEQVKKTRFARPGYVYLKKSSNPDNQ